MHELVRQEVGRDPLQIRIDQRALLVSVVARLVMLQAEVRHVVAERVEEMIVAVVAGAEQCARLLHQILVFRDDFGTHLQGAIAVGGDVQIMGGPPVRAEVDRPVVRPHGERRIDQRGQRSRLKLDLAAAFAANRQRRAVPPVRRDLQRGLQLDGIRIRALGIEQQLIPVQHRQLAGGRSA